MIFSKNFIQKDIDEYKARTDKLLKILNGVSLNQNIYNKYANTPEEFNNNYVEIDLQELDYAISDFNTSLNMLKKLKARKAKPLHQSR